VRVEVIGVLRIQEPQRENVSSVGSRDTTPTSVQTKVATTTIEVAAEEVGGGGSRAGRGEAQEGNTRSWSRCQGDVFGDD